MSTKPERGLPIVAKTVRKMTHLQDNLMGAAGVSSDFSFAAQAWKLENAVLVLLIFQAFSPVLIRNLLVYDTCMTRCEL